MFRKINIVKGSRWFLTIVVGAVVFVILMFTLVPLFGYYLGSL